MPEAASDSTPFPTIGVAMKPGDPQAAETADRVADRLRASGRDVLVDTEHVTLAGGVSELAEFAESCDLVITVGGDGTLLNVGRNLAPFNTPLLGINMGRLGFLADVSPSTCEMIDRVLSGHWIEEHRLILEAHAGEKAEPGAGLLALNEVSINRGRSAHLVEVETRANGSVVNRLRADGLLVATPTGSTAYALSSGGPIIHPTVAALLMVPISPHSLSSRPIVLPADSTISMHIFNKAPDRVRVSCDAQHELDMTECDTLTIRRSRHSLRLIHPEFYDYYDILRRKLHWGDPKNLAGKPD